MPNKTLDVAERQERLRRRMTAAVIVAGQLRQEYPDPIQSLIDLFANLSPAWQKMEAEADEDLRLGHYRTFDTIEDFVAFLDEEEAKVD